VRQILDGFASVAELRDQRLELQAPAALEAEVDEEKLVSVVSNLVANALKHAPAGGSVRVRVAAVRQRLRLEVADDGPAFPPACARRSSSGSSRARGPRRGQAAAGWASRSSATSSGCTEAP
jgi:signal transduction histidine kinase